MDSSGESFLYTGQSKEDIPRNVTHVKVEDPAVKKIGQMAFQYCEQLINVELCEGLERIEQAAFSGCRSLTSIRIPSTVREIGWASFHDCSRLINVELPEGLRRIGLMAFRWCSSLTSIRIPSTVYEIVDEAFCACYQLVNVELCEGLETIHYHVFYECESLESITIPSTVNHIHRNAFAECTSLIKVEFCEEIEQFINEVSLPWWNHGVSKAACMTYSFLAQSNIPARLDRLKMRVWKDNIHNMLQRIPEELKDIEDEESNDDSNDGMQFIKEEHGDYFDSMKYRLRQYEYLQQVVAPMLELALWKAKMEEQSNGNPINDEMKLQCRYNSLSMVPIIIPNALSFLCGG
jgi:hypothetical protein